MARTDRIWNTLRLTGWAAVPILLLLPLVLGAPWTRFDYVVAASALVSAGLVLELLSRLPGSFAYRMASAMAVAGCVLLFWVNGAVGFLGDEGNPANLLFIGVVAIAVLGAVATGFRASGMAAVMFAAAVIQVAIGIAAIALGLGAPGVHGVYEAALGTTLFAAIWLLAGALFRKAAVSQSA